MKKAIAMCLIACMVMTGCGGSKGGAGEPQETVAGSDGQNVKIKDEIIFCQGNDLTTLDATIGQQERAYSISNNIFDPLFTYDSDMKMQPCLATEYEWADDTTLKLTLREGVKFHDGSDMNAEDVKFTLDLIDQRGALFVGNYDGCTIDDDYHVTVKLKAPNPAFLSILTLPQASVVPAEYDEAAFGANPIGTGPYKLKEAVEGDYYTLERFDDYWGEKPDLTKVTYKIIENADSILLSLQSGAVDVFAHLTTNQIQQLGDGFHVEEGTMNLVQALYLNNAEKPFDDVRVRQALCYAIDRQQILDLAFDGYGTLLGSSMYPAFSKYFDDELTNYYTYNTEKAKELLTEAGYPNGFDMTITVPSNYQSHMDTAQVIVEQLKAVGINATIQPVTWESWVQDTYSNRQFQSTVVGVDASNMTARAMLERFVSTASRDFINYNNADYDALFAQAQACYDDGEQTALYRAMEKNLAENAANVYIQDMADFVAVRDGLEGPSFYPIYVLDLSTIHYTK